MRLVDRWVARHETVAPFLVTVAVFALCFVGAMLLAALFGTRP